MKIVLIIDWFLYYTVELANAFAQEHDVLLVTRDHNFEISSPDEPISLDTFLDSVLDPKVQRLTLRFRRGAIANLKEVPRVLAVLKKFDSDIIHIQENSDWRILFLVKMFARQKRVLTIHDVVSHPGEGNGLLQNIIQMLRQSCGKIIVHGDFLKQQLMQVCPDIKGPIKVIPHGVLSSYKRWDDQTIVEDDMTILFFGRLNRYKGLDLLLEAHRLVLKSMPLVRLIIAGKGDSLPEAAIQDVQRKNLEIHNRYIANSEVARFMRRAAVVVLPYTEASQSGVVPIAFSFGKPVVATAVGSIPEVVIDGSNGYIVPPNDPSALAEALLGILSDKCLRQTMGQRAQEFAETVLDWKEIAKKTAEFYRV